MRAMVLQSWWAGISGLFSQPATVKSPGSGARSARQQATAGSRAAGAQTGFWPGFVRQHAATPGGETDRPATEKPLSILVPTDFSAASRPAMDCALRMAAGRKACVTLLHAIQLNLIPHGPANTRSLKTELCREALAKAGPVLETARELKIPAACAVQEGRPAEVIGEVARRLEPDLIVLANSKRRRLRGWLGRKTVERVAREAGCPVLILPTV